MKSHLTYNEYPLEVMKLEIDDEQGVRTSEGLENNPRECRTLMGTTSLEKNAKGSSLTMCR